MMVLVAFSKIRLYYYGDEFILLHFGGKTSKLASHGFFWHEGTLASILLATW